MCLQSFSSTKMKIWISHLSNHMCFASLKCVLHHLSGNNLLTSNHQGGLTGILVQGSNGEAQHLSCDERKETIRFTRKTLDENGFENVIIIAGTGVQSTRETKKLCADACEAGAAYALVLTPSTWPPQMTKDNIIRFHREVRSIHQIVVNRLYILRLILKVADASPIPTMIYNFPRVTAGIDLDSSIITELAAHPNIVGVKLSCGNIGKLHRITTDTKPSEFAVFTGRSDVLSQGLLSGSAGGIVALANIAPKIHTKLFKLWKEGKQEEAMKIQATLGHGDWAVSKIGGISGVKAVVNKEFGYGNGRVRGPLAPTDLGVGAEVYKLVDDLMALEKTL
jgi:4-hydroxy-2-oxoglutarate aldolase